MSTPLTPPLPQALPCVVGASRRIREAAEQVELIAQTEATCLLLGETGTGKELFARAIHYLSPRKHLPFVPVNCGAIPDALFENEIFGHVRGAYTDARSEETGLLAYAGNGTLFLDEVDALSAAAQVKLLRVLQEQEYRPIGSARTYHTDVRVVAATNCDLRHCVACRTFREDLFHRLNVLRLTIPPLRDRAEDIPLLVSHFVKEFADRHRRPVRGIEQDATSRLMAYRWPGNVRELQGVLQRAVLLARGDSIVTADLDLPGNEMAGNPAEAAAGQPFENSLKSAKEIVVRQFELSYLANVLRLSEGNVSRAARMAGKERRSFQRLLRKYCIVVTSFRST
jgi:transcriptional regulator with PAS, ATPase and Fis domain